MCDLAILNDSGSVSNTLRNLGGGALRQVDGAVGSPWEEFYAWYSTMLPSSMISTIERMLSSGFWEIESLGMIVDWNWLIVVFEARVASDYML